MSQPVLACAELFRFEDDVPQLLGSECSDCGETYFPAAAGCTRCLSPHMKPREFGRRGTLWSWTIQAFLPKAPYDSGETADTFKPYGVGYVEMDCGLKVESRLTVAHPEALRIGMPLELTLIPYRVGADGAQTFTFAFQPAMPAEQGAEHG